MQTTSQPSKKKKKTPAAQPKPTSNVSTNGVTVQRNQLSNRSNATPTPTIEELNSSSIENGCRAFAHILSGCDVKQFMEHQWEKTPLYIARENRGHYNNLKVSTSAIDEMLRNNIVEYTKNLDVTSYENGVAYALLFKLIFIHF